jgi:hypothetical protein
MVTIPGFSSGFTIVKYPADFVFPLFRDKGGVFENSEHCRYAHCFYSFTPGKNRGLFTVNVMRTTPHNSGA